MLGTDWVRSRTISSAEPHPFVGRALGVGEAFDALVVAHAAGAERVEEQLERTAERAGIGLAGEHHHAGREPVDQLADESGLADPRLAADQGDRRSLSGVDEAGEPLELVGPSGHLR